MSALDQPVPEAGEEIHLPGGSNHPLLLTLGITVGLVGVTVSPVFLTLPGVILSVVIIVLWIRDARREMAALPAHTDH